MWLFRQISWLGCLIFRSCIRFNGVVPDCVVYERLKLHFGNGFFECIHTPGHTRGSMSVRFDHMLFAGDTFFHLLPGSIFPPFANDVKTLRKSWSKIARSGIKKIFPGHGKVFSIKLLSQQEK
jgi:glyoxylase-like metal-dependent hydrolase (beta-lactamase superfamily II)